MTNEAAEHVDDFDYDESGYEEVEFFEDDEFSDEPAPKSVTNLTSQATSTEKVVTALSDEPFDAEDNEDGKIIPSADDSRFVHTIQDVNQVDPTGLVEEGAERTSIAATIRNFCSERWSMITASRSRVLTIIAVVLLLLLVLFSIYSFLNQVVEVKNEYVAPTETIVEGSINRTNSPDQPDATLSISKLSTGEVMVNGFHDAVAQLLVSNYVSKDDFEKEMRALKNPAISESEFQLFLESIRRNAKDIEQMQEQLRTGLPSNANPSQIDDLTRILKTEMPAITAAINAQNKQINAITQKLSKLDTSVTSLDKTNERIIDRVVKLEKQATWTGQVKRTPVAEPAVAPQETRRVELSKTSPWVVKGASENEALIYHAAQKRLIRIRRNQEIAGQGTVISIDPKKREVVTTGGLITSHRQ